MYADKIAGYLNQRAIPGVRFELENFTPDSSLYKGELCQGVRVVLIDRNALQVMRLGIEIASTVGKLSDARMVRLLGNDATIEQLVDGEDPVSIVASWNKDLEAFRKVRAKYLLYRGGRKWV